MCKFTNHLFVFAVCTFLLHLDSCLGAAILERENPRALLDLLSQDYDYDLHYDQRQKGGENLRVKLDGFFIGLPAQEPTSLMVLTDDLLESLGEDLLMSLGKSRSSTTAPENAQPYKADVGRLNKPDSNSEGAAPEDQQKSEPIYVEIPAPKKELEARNREGDQNHWEDRSNVSRTKSYLHNFLSLLRRSRGE